MMRTRLSLLLGACALAFGCSSKVTSFLDPDLQKRVSTLEDCFPPLWDKVDQLLEVTALWQLQNVNNPPDPAGLTFQLDGPETAVDFVDVTYVLGACTLTMRLDFFDGDTAVLPDLTRPAGALPNTSLSNVIDNAATDMRDQGQTNPYMLATWSLAGTGITGSGNLTGAIGGTANNNELERVTTTDAVPAAPLPTFVPFTDPNASTIEVGGGQPCVLRLDADLQTDSTPDQEYPIGDMSLQIQGSEAAITVAATFDGTAVVILEVQDTGTFTFDIASGDLSFDG
ncbi:MAG: hypothetical protein VYE77_07825 [Planctomycetota bacterium]|nr:hypothetical protein [Planctomycetota bacterium]